MYYKLLNVHMLYYYTNLNYYNTNYIKGPPCTARRAESDAVLKRSLFGSALESRRSCVAHVFRVLRRFLCCGSFVLVWYGAQYNPLEHMD